MNPTPTELALRRLREVMDDYGLDAVEAAYEKLIDEAQERSCSDDRPSPAWNE